MPFQAQGPYGHPKNCNEWAKYEAPATSDSATLCNGGWFEGTYYPICPSRAECKEETIRKDTRRLPIVNPQRTFGGSRLLASTERHVPVSMPTRQASAPMTHQPSQIVKPDETVSPALRTPYVMPNPTLAVSPTFVPEDDEGIFSRLGKNIAQGMVNATGWHIFDFSRHVDMFGGKKKR